MHALLLTTLASSVDVEVNAFSNSSNAAAMNHHSQRLVPEQWCFKMSMLQHTCTLRTLVQYAYGNPEVITVGG